MSLDPPSSTPRDPRAAPSPISTNLSTRHVMVNSLRCAGPDSWVTVYSGRRQPFCTTSSWRGDSPGTAPRARQRRQKGAVGPKMGITSPKMEITGPKWG